MPQSSRVYVWLGNQEFAVTYPVVRMASLSPVRRMVP